MRWLKLLGLHVTGGRTRTEPHPDCDRVVAVAELDRVLPDTEFLVLACPLTAQTRELLDRRRTALLPRGAGVVNVGRGALVEQDALLDAPDAGHLGGAVLDVFMPEPAPPGHCLWRTPNLVMTPHMSSDDPGTYVARSPDTFFAVAAECCSVGPSSPTSGPTTSTASTSTAPPSAWSVASTRSARTSCSAPRPRPDLP